MTGTSSKWPCVLSPPVLDVEELIEKDENVNNDDPKTSKKNSVDCTKDIDAFFDAPAKVGGISKHQCITCK